MPHSKPIQITAAVLVALTAGCGGSVRSGAPAPSSTSTDYSQAEAEAILRARRDSARANYTPADVHFMTGMIGHHGQALLMAGLAESHEASSQVRVLAARIINAQRDEIALMQAWLRSRGLTVPEVHIEGLTLTVHGAGHAVHMPGMLREEQVRELDAARGPTFDRLFLEYMIQHHRGAVTMVQQLVATDRAARDDTVFKLASDVEADQTTEIARMQLMLAALPTP
jgi:uncharacterized protein (DUF305 family)